MNDEGLGRGRGRRGGRARPAAGRRGARRAGAASGRTARCCGWPPGWPAARGSSAARPPGSAPSSAGSRPDGRRSRRPAGPAVRRSGLDGQPVPAPQRAGLPGGGPDGGGAAGRRRAGLARRHAAEVPAHQPRRRGRAEQQPAAQPRRLEGGHRHRRRERGARPARAWPRTWPRRPGCRPWCPPGPSRWARTWPSRRAAWSTRPRQFELIQYQPVTETVLPLPAADRAPDDQQVLHHRPGPRAQHGSSTWSAQGHQVFVDLAGATPTPGTATGTWTPTAAP